MRIYREEMFAPVFSVITFKTDEEAVKYANDHDCQSTSVRGAYLGLEQHGLDHVPLEAVLARDDLRALGQGVVDGALDVASSPSRPTRRPSSMPTTTTVSLLQFAALTWALRPSRRFSPATICAPLDKASSTAPLTRSALACVKSRV
jgi:hypothetical protein